MALLGNIFARKNKSSRSIQNPPSSIYSQTTSEADSALSSPTAEYGTPDRPLPSIPNGKLALHPYDALRIQPPPKPPSKLRLFGRKKSSPTSSTLTHSTDLTDPPQPSYLGRASTGTASDGDVDTRRLRPPPSKSAIFAAYGDPYNALSTRSLPNDASLSSIDRALAPPPNPPKKSSFFHWKSSPSPSLKQPIVVDPPSPPPDSSFNLKSFRHIRAPSPTRPTSGANSSNVSLSAPIPRPRPRDPSVTPDSSQRISVAAFREAQARRSTAGSPVPSFRSPSPLPPPIPISDATRGRSSPLLQPPEPIPRPRSYAQTRANHARSAGHGVYSSDSDESEEPDEDSDDDGRKSSGIKSKGRAQSELGHGSSYASPSRRKNFTPGPRSQSAYVMSQLPQPYNNQSSLTVTTNAHSTQSNKGAYSTSLRARASVSTSALTPNAAAKRASILAAANPSPNGQPASRHAREASVQSNPAPRKGLADDDSRSSDSEDDAPLASLVPPRRPGSSMASHNGSNTSLGARSASGGQQKPLIDINELVKGPTKPLLKEDGFTTGATLLATRHPTTAEPPLPPVVSREPPTKFISPPSSPTRHSRDLSNSTILPPLPPPPSASPNPSSSSSDTWRPYPQSMVSAPAVPHSAVSGDWRPEYKRDMLSERLNRVVKQGASPSPNLAPSSPPTKEVSPIASPIALPPPPLATRTSSGSTSSTPSATTSGGHRRIVPTIIPQSTSPEPFADDLANLLGAGVRLIKRTEDSETEDESSEESDDEESTDGDEEDRPTPGQIAPIPIKRRTPPPAFSVTSRPKPKPPQPQQMTTAFSTATASSTSTSSASQSIAPPKADTTRKRSSTLIPTATSSSLFGGPPSWTTHTSSSSKPNSPLPSARDSLYSSGLGSSPGGDRAKPSPIAVPRQRSSTMVPLMAVSPVSPSPSMFPPTKPFAVRRNSPASSTGDSSSGRGAPMTPRDGSDIGSASGSASVSTRQERETRSNLKGANAKKEEWSGGVSGLGLSGVKGRNKRRSVSFEDDLQQELDAVGGADGVVSDSEARRRERRRSEAKAAIELGNVINGRGPIMDDDDEDDLPVNQARQARMGGVNPMMGMGMQGMQMGMPMGMNMNMNMGMPMMSSPGAGWNQQPMLSPAQFMPPQPTDPTLYMAHQQAMMFAKQAYQMAVAQQAMAAAADEWERGSTMGGSVYGGGGGGGSVYGGGMGMNGMRMGGSPGWSGSVIFPNDSRSMYGNPISSSRSDYGGGLGGGRGGDMWSSSKSSYGESFGPDRFNGKPNASNAGNSGSGGRSSKYAGGGGERERGGGGGNGGGASRQSGLFPPVPPIPQSERNTGAGSPGWNSARPRTTSQPGTPNRGVKRAPPPSSWKAGV
ncbi:hypothetical protein BDN72DRAFT_896768 [Pluteus cervinus]|uniref:Uncharacterized protein n=1 Tax=Pluteus cervinus TaxID=181527 RepID=A0ACD3AWF0_9AGAR|nr:hypothetical protein BDN72DRAFT_896768 [Pluteus cervinus]